MAIVQAASIVVIVLMEAVVLYAGYGHLARVAAPRVIGAIEDG